MPREAFWARGGKQGEHCHQGMIKKTLGLDSHCKIWFGTPLHQTYDPQCFNFVGQPFFRTHLESGSFMHCGRAWAISLRMEFHLPCQCHMRFGSGLDSWHVAMIRQSYRFFFFEAASNLLVDGSSYNPASSLHGERGYWIFWSFLRGTNYLLFFQSYSNNGSRCMCSG